jgi:hypothetical protein
MKATSLLRVLLRATKHICHTLLLAVLISSMILMPVLSARAENWVWYYSSDVPLNRAQHGFEVHSAQTTFPGSVTGGGYIGAYVDVDQEGPFTLWDTTANQYRNLTSGGGGIGDSGGGWISPNGINVEYFLIDVNRAGHTLILEQSNGTYHLMSVGSADWPALLPASAEYNPSFSYDVLDLTTMERTGSGQTYLPSDVWQDATSQPPIAEVTIYVSGGNAGQGFTLHSIAPGGTEEQLQTAVAGPRDPNYDGFSPVTAPVGLGMTFWVTRNCDGVDQTQSAGMTVDASMIVSGQRIIYYLQNLFGDPPMHLVYLVVNASLSGRTLYVDQGGGIR